MCAAAADLLRRVRFDVLALAPHTVEASALALRKKGLTAVTHLFVPVFPISVPTEHCTDSSACQSGGVAMQRGFVLQGLFQAQRYRSPSYLAGDPRSLKETFDLHPLMDGPVMTGR